MSKRRSSSTADNLLLKSRRTGIDPQWNDDFPWKMAQACYVLCVVNTLDAPKNLLLAKLYTPCRSITRQALVKHGRSESHTNAVKLEAVLGSARTDGGIRAFQQVVSAERKSMIGSLKCTFSISKR